MALIIYNLVLEWNIDCKFAMATKRESNQTYLIISYIGVQCDKFNFDVLTSLLSYYIKNVTRFTFSTTKTTLIS